MIRYKRHTTAALFAGDEQRQMDSIPAMRSHVPDAKDRQLVIKPIRDTADHTECFYPGCNAERVHSNMARSPDGKLLVCEEHRNENDYPFASYAHNRWKNGYAEPVHEDKGSE